MKALQTLLTLGTFMCSALTLGVSTGAHAGSSPYQEAITQASREQALGQQTVPLLEVVPPDGGREAQIDRLLDLLHNSSERRIHARTPGAMQRSQRSTIIFAQDHSWYLEVDGDGSRFRFRADIDNPTEVAAAAAAGRLPMDTLERLGRSYITEQLRPLVDIPDTERLVFLGTRYLRQGSATAADPTFTSEVVANIAIFGREIRGMYVAGPGSKIAVWVSNRGEIVGFDVDWPVYQVATQTQETLPIGEVRNRLYAYTETPQDLIERNTTHFECGYIDLGVHRRGRASVQPGCAVRHDGPLPDGGKYASIEIVPIGVSVVEDSDWPVTKLIATGQPWDPCQVSRTACQEPPPEN